MYKVQKVYCDKSDRSAFKRQRQVFFSSRCSTVNNYSLLLVAPKDSEPVPTAPLKRTSKQKLDLPTKDHDQRRRSTSPSLQLVSGYISSVIDWFSGVRLKDLFDTYNIVLLVHAASPSGGSTTERGDSDETVSESFLVHYGKDGEEARDAFVTTLRALKLFLLGVCSPDLHEEFLKDLFDHIYGPVSLEDFPKMVVKWNKADPGSQVVIDVNVQYEDGLTALHLACDGGQEDVVQELLQLGADSSVIDREDNTVYHSAVSSGNEKCLKVLLDFDSEFRGAQYVVKLLSAQNCDGHTPLMLATSSNQVPAVVQLLCADADVNVTSKETGDSALHIAACKGYLDLTRLLSVFDASLATRNNKNETPLDAAVNSEEPGAIECAESLGALVEGSPSIDLIPLADYPLHGPVLLSLDGGGIRGLVEVVMLNELESILMDLDPKFKSLAGYFDWMIGTSTGSFVTIGLAYQNLRPRRIRCVYFEMTEEMKKLSSPYPDEGYNKIMKYLFSEYRVLTDVTTPKVAITTTLADRSPPELHLMCNYGEARQGEKGPSERKLWEAARASTAAPTYFEAFENKFIDGGVIANNPTLDGMTEMVEQAMVEGKSPKIGMVVSLGAGVLASDSVDEINIRRGVSHLLQNLKGLAGIMKVLVSQITSSDGRVVEQARAWCSNTNCPYFRLSPPISEISMTESDTGKMAEMMFQGLIYVKRNEGSIRQLAELLIQHKSI